MRHIFNMTSGRLRETSKLGRHAFNVRVHGRTCFKIYMDDGAVEYASGAQARKSMCPSEPIVP